MLFSAIVIEQVPYYALLLGSNKKRMRSAQILVNSGLYWIEGFSNGINFFSLFDNLFYLYYPINDLKHI